MIKSAPLLHLLNQDTQVTLQLVHSGQHYDFEMSKIFFNELSLPDPRYNCNVGSGSHATQTANMMIAIERAIDESAPDVVVVFGDANTTLAGALTAKKMHVPVCHVEAGLRSFDSRMPEEVNRIVTDHCSRRLCVPTEEARRNLRRENIPSESITLTGDTMYDAIVQHRADIAQSTILHDLAVEPDQYAVLTLHRPENVDNPTRLRNIISAILTFKLNIVFPIHPRTEPRLKQLRLMTKLAQTAHIQLSKPVGYYGMLNLIQHSKVVLTDSGGMQKEAFWFAVPCITLRDNTEWVETLSLGANTLVGADPERITQEFHRITTDETVKAELARLPNPFGDGHAAKNIMTVIKQM